MTQIFVLQYTDTQRVEPVIKPFLTQPGGNSVAVPEQKLLIVTDLYSNILRRVGVDSPGGPAQAACVS